MVVPRTARPARCLAVTALATALLALAVVGLLPDLSAARGALVEGGPGDFTGGAFERLLVGLCAATALLAATWLWAVACVVSLAAASGHPWHRRAIPGVPVRLRRLVLVACGVTLAGALTVPAGADPGSLPVDRHGAGVLRGLPLPDRPVGAAGPPRTDSDPAARPRHPIVTVRRGDTLWALAAHRLPRGATAADITACWQRIHRLNRAVIGPDPDLIQPTQRLRLPRC